MDYVYILTNDSYKGFVKVGKAVNPEERAKQLSRQTGVLTPFSVYAKMAVPHKDVFRVEKFLHDTVGIWNVRQKEFFKTTPEKALDLFKNLADLNGYKITVPGQAPEPAAKAPNTTFGSLGIAPGTRLYYIPDSEETCTTIDDKNSVEYNGVKTTLSGIAKKLLGYSYNGYTIFSTEPDGEPLVSK